MKIRASILIVLVAVLAAAFTISATGSVTQFPFPGEIGIHMVDPSAAVSDISSDIVSPDTSSQVSITMSTEPSDLSQITIIYSVPNFPFQSELGYHLAVRGEVRTLSGEEGMHIVPYTF
jgi:hypothetical protein